MFQTVGSNGSDTTFIQPDTLCLCFDGECDVDNGASMPHDTTQYFLGRHHGLMRINNFLPVLFTQLNRAQFLASLSLQTTERERMKIFGTSTMLYVCICTHFPHTTQFSSFPLVLSPRHNNAELALRHSTFQCDFHAFPFFSSFFLDLRQNKKKFFSPESRIGKFSVKINNKIVSVCQWTGEGKENINNFPLVLLQSVRRENSALSNENIFISFPSLIEKEQRKKSLITECCIGTHEKRRSKRQKTAPKKDKRMNDKNVVHQFYIEKYRECSGGDSIKHTREGEKAKRKIRGFYNEKRLRRRQRCKYKYRF